MKLVKFPTFFKTKPNERNSKILRVVNAEKEFLFACFVAIFRLKLIELDPLGVQLFERQQKPKKKKKPKIIRRPQMDFDMGSYVIILHVFLTFSSVVASFRCEESLKGEQQSSSMKCAMKIRPEGR